MPDQQLIESTIHSAKIAYQAKSSCLPLAGVQQAIQHLLGHRLGDPKADPSLLPAMREGMERLAIRDADQRLVDLLQSVLD